MKLVYQGKFRFLKERIYEKFAFVNLFLLKSCFMNCDNVNYIDFDYKKKSCNVSINCKEIVIYLILMLLPRFCLFDPMDFLLSILVILLDFLAYSSRSSL